MKKLILSLVTTVSVLAFVGCSNGDSGGGNGVIPVTCNAGTTWNGQYCVGSNGGIVSPGVTSIRYYDYVYYFQINYWTKAPLVVNPSAKRYMKITNTAVYKKFLKEAMAVCDRNIWGWNSGYSDCNNWTNGSLILQIDLNNTLQPSVYFTAIPSQQYFNFSFGIDGGGMAYNPLALIQNTTYSLINQSKGFEIRSNGASTNAGGLHLIQIQVFNGTTASNQVNYQIGYPDANGKGTVFATGTLTKY